MVAMFSRRTAWKLTPNPLTIALDAYRRSGGELLDLTASNPTTVGLHYDPQTILEALASPGALTYRPEPKGLLPARAAVAEYYRKSCEAEACQVDPENIVLTVSTSEAYSYIFRLLCDPGDEVLVPTPSYPLFEFLAGLQDVQLVPYPLVYDHGWHIDFYSLEKALAPHSRAIILVHPNNPTGSCIKWEERQRLNRICKERGLALVVDEVFLDYVIGEGGDSCIVGRDSIPNPARAPRNTTFACNREALTFTLSGISKICGLPQMKLAWIVTSGPEEVTKDALSRLEVIADTFLSQNAPIQLAAPALLQQRHSIREQLLARIHLNLAELDRQLASHRLCSRLEVEAGWYVILRVPAIRSDEQLGIELLQKCGVLVQPGYFYDFHGDGYIVLSLITPVSEFQEGIRRTLALVS
jgi:alanine-synthesizing transaminase